MAVHDDDRRHAAVDVAAPVVADVVQVAAYAVAVDESAVVVAAAAAQAPADIAHVVAAAERALANRLTY